MKAQTRIVKSEPPKDAHCFISGQYFKVGRFNRVFAYRNGEWVFTNSMTVDRIGREIHKQEVEARAEELKNNKKEYVL